jgi:cell division transport system ATP-binding protein
MIIIKSISKHYPPNIRALEDVSLTIETGEFVSVVGQSGAGKSTLLRLLSAEEAPTYGSIVIDGWEITNIRPWQVPYLRRQIGIVFQDFKLLPKKTVYENVAFAMEVSGDSTAEIKRAVPQLLKLVNLEKQAQQYPSQLSGGEQQRVSLARALAHKPRILLADEPTGNLDALHSWDIIQLLLKVNSLGTTVILATHDENIVNAVRRRVVTLDRGRVTRDEERGTYKL